MKPMTDKVRENAKNEEANLPIDLNLSKPAKSVRPTKSMVRVKSFKPQRIELGRRNRKRTLGF